MLTQKQKPIQENTYELQTRKWKVSAGTDENHRKAEGNCLQTLPQATVSLRRKPRCLVCTAGTRDGHTQGGTSFSYGR